jgi:hypothetical protein
MLPFTEVMMKPTHPLEVVRCLAENEGTCEFFKPVLQMLRDNNMDSDDLREIIMTELGEHHCVDTQPTRKYYPSTVSDYFSIWVDDCGAQMFLKYLIDSDRLVVTSFKRDTRYARTLP